MADLTERLAIEGGQRLRNESFPPDYPDIDNRDIDRVLATLKSKKLTIFTSAEVEKFEGNFRSYIGSRYCTFTINCTSAISAALMASRRRRGGEVIMPAYTYAATAMAAVSLGFKPVFADVDLDSYTVSPEAVESLVTRKTTAVIGVHLFGNPFNVTKLKKIEAENDNLKLIEDCAQATGATFKGKQVGSFGIGCHSFGENKILRIGEGGALTTNDPEVDRRVKLVRHEGEAWVRTGESGASVNNLTYSDFVYGFDYVLWGFNYRPVAYQASLASSQLGRLQRNLNKRRENARYLYRKLRSYEDIILPRIQEEGESAWYSFVVRVDSRYFDRDTFLTSLLLEGIPAGVHYPKPLPSCSVFRNFSKAPYPNTKLLCEQQVALPVYPDLSERHLDTIAEGVGKVLRRLEEAPRDLKRLAKQQAKTLRIRDVYSGLYMVA
jgi:perosamine synthetase